MHADTLARVAPEPYRIALVDDHRLMRSCMADTMERIVPDHRVTLQADHGKDLIAQLEAGAEVDLVVLDLEMPEMNGYDTLDWLNANRPGLPVLILSFNASEESLHRTLGNGARGYLLKTADSDTFRAALQCIRSSGYYHDARTHQGMMSLHDQEGSFAQQRAAKLKELSDRELEFIKLVALGLSYKEVADRMSIGYSGVISHQRNVFKSMNITSQSGIVVFAYEWDLIRPRAGKPAQ